MSSPRSSNWFEANPRKARWLIAILCLGFLEGMTRILVGLDLLPYREYPTSRVPRYWAYVDPVVGIWRYPNTTLLQQEYCLDAKLQSNAEGARDIDRQKHSAAARRFVVLGDSFIEGYGVNAEDRVTNLLEARTGIEFLNFATSGGFGTIQEWLLYQSRVLQYEHTDVILFILPANDFEDNDPDEFSASVYRPFLRPEGDGYEVYYTVPWERRYTDSRAMSTVIKNRFDNALYLANVLRWATRELKGGLSKQRFRTEDGDYDNHSPEDLRIMLYALDQLIRAAGERRVWLLTVPTARDFAAARRGEEFRLDEELGAFAARYPNVSFRDLLPDFLNDAAAHDREFTNYLLECDNHWGALGNQVVADWLQAWLFAPPPGTDVHSEAD
ncbi:MAG: SGNH/GDSL hydrolase family protein [Gammaproteobacteria bacterium]|nr:SGNH/GDSL hydrolase family protein [Gammaproteobacteria bacterium]MDH5276366.1 SGNH/GDSL hydrolase family protein [Gammaproteobacteria bacterium]